jgi:hypothetical protein
MNDELEELKRQISSQKAEWERDKKRLKLQLEEKDHQLEGTMEKKKELERQLEEKDHQLEGTMEKKKELERQLEEKDHQLEENDRKLKAKDHLLIKKDLQLEEKDRQLEAKSLHAVLSNTDLIQEICCIGSPSSNLYPTNHPAAGLVRKSFTLLNMIPIVEELKRTTGCDPKLECLSSGVISEFEKSQKRKTYSNEVEVAFFVNLALRDATYICNALLSSIAAISSEGTAQPIELEVRQEMSIFSNRFDHAIVVDSTSNAPIFCVETKKHFGKNFQNSSKNRSLGQSFDQLHDMRLLGLSSPLGALTCFNQTYFTCIDPKIEWDSSPTLQSLKNTITHLPGIRQPNTTPSPLKVVPATQTSITAETNFVKAGNRCIMRSSTYIDQNHLVAAFVIVILNAVKGNYKPKPFQMFTKGDRIDVDCINMNTNPYEWGKLTTTYNGPYQTQRFGLQQQSTNLYLLRCVGTGSTSKAYHAITQDGGDCIAKLYVQRHLEDGWLKTKERFKNDSKEHVTNEVNNYQKIYTNELNDYVSQQELYGMDCIILPFFHPIPVSERETVIPIIKTRLELFTKHKLAFRDCDQSWRHIGRFNGEIYLFDLGDLEPCNNKATAEKCASNHVSRLTKKNE